ncbi:MAG: oligosaccharide flippase family protein [Anaerolineae bacterium]|nr:oligosaccharide flippase family protein [Anaerolineae bacterium]
MSIGQRTVRSTAYTVTASIIQTGVQFARSIILARVLDVDVFGIYAFAASWIVATRMLGQFGLGDALLHRARESEGEIALRVHFTLSLIFSVLWALALAAASPILIPDTMPDVTLTVLWALIAAEFFGQLTYTANSLLVKRVVFRRISLINVAVTVVATVAALILAWQGFGVWSLVATDIAKAVVLVVGYYIYRPVWRPRLGWSKKIVRYFLSFGRRSFLASLLLRALDRIDDLWSGFFLGEMALGYYSRAYRFATYPRSILASPLNSVASGTYAELKDKPKRLAQAFFRINALLVRTGFLLAGLLALVAPEFIRIVIGSKWLPMLTAFRLMLVFTLLDPIKATVASLFVAVGCPEKTVRARSIQLVVLVIGLFTLGSAWGIEGVALAVDLMLIVGIGLLLWQAKAHIQFSIVRLFAVPTFALTLSMAVARAAIEIPGILGSPWRTGSVKTVVFVLLYAGLLLLLERDLVPMARSIIRQALGKRQENQHE